MHTIRMLVAVAAASLAAGTFADDFSPPSWRGQSLTTAQEWEFQNATNPTFPDGNSVSGIYGNGMGGQLPYASFNNMSWETGDGDGQWFPNSSAGQIFLNIPDWIDLEPIKYVYIQIAWDGPQPPIILGVSGFDNVAGGVDGRSSLLRFMERKARFFNGISSRTQTGILLRFSFPRMRKSTKSSWTRFRFQSLVP